MNEPFDDHIKSKLGDFIPDFKKEGIWEEFEHYRDNHKPVNGNNDVPADNHIDKAFNTSIQNNLNKHSVPFNNQHWDKMKVQIQTYETRKHYIYFSKFIEIASIILIFFALTHKSSFISTHPIFDYLPKNDRNHVYNSTEQVNLKNTTNTYKEPLLDDLNTSTPSELNTKYDHTFTAQGYKTNGLSSDAVAVNSLAASSSFDSDNHNTTNSSLGRYEAITDNTHDKTFYKGLEILPSITPLAFTLESLNHELQPETPRIIPLKNLTIKDKTNTIVSLYSSADVNLINTPFDKVYSRASYYKEALSNSYGIGISRRFHTLEIGVGLAYAQREYNPEVIEEIYGIRENLYSQVTFNKISYEIVSIPVQLNYRFIDKPTWSAYVMSSAITHLVMQADYGINDVIVMGRPSIEYNQTFTKSRMDEKPFIDGLIHGDNIQDDYFISVGFGFGIEKAIFKDASIYMQPSYQRHILSADIGIGPNKDKIHTSSLLVGFKYSLN